MSHSDDLLKMLRRSVIGCDEAVHGPFGVRRVTYADYTASGRSVSFVEDLIREAVLPLYANTHTESSGTGLQTTRFREDAREIIRRCTGANKTDHAVIFCGTGATGVIDRLVGLLNLRIPNDLDAKYGLSDHIPAEERPVVFVGPYEHHSNELPWRESIADVVEIRECPKGGIDLEHLEEELERFVDRPLKIGSFSAASNVTGIVSNTRDTAVLLHRFGALSFWDFAAAAPYIDIDMSPEGDGEEIASAYKDAVFISPHKLPGGPGTPGVLVVRKELLTNRVPVVSGGGSVSWVGPESHAYLSDPEQREEAGTPDIIGSIRAGLVFLIKETVGVETIRKHEESFIHRAIESWNKNPNIEILGSQDAERLSIVSFVVRHEGRYLHHSLVVSLLNDLLGIQARGGCACAGPYGHRLLGIDADTARGFYEKIGRGCEGIKPGWVRVNFNYFISEETFQFILDGVDLVAREGWRILDQYDFELGNGLWRHTNNQAKPPLSLDEVQLTAEGFLYPQHRHTEPEERLPVYLEEARRILAEATPGTGPGRVIGASDEEFERLRWFPFPNESAPATR